MEPKLLSVMRTMHLTSFFFSWRSFTYILPVLLVLSMSHPLDHFLSLFSFSAVCENVCLCVRLSIFFFHSDLFLFALLLLVDVCSICSGELNSSQ